MAKAKTKKRWFKLVAPQFSNEQVVGETPAFEPKSVMDRTITVNLASLTNDIKKQNNNITLIVNKVEGDKGLTSILGYELIPTSIKRLVRKGRTRLDQTLKVITADDKVVTLKIILITRNVIPGAVFTNMQNQLKRLVIKKVSTTLYDELASEIVTSRFQKDIRNKLNKVYPLRICDVRFFKLERFLKATEIKKIKDDIARMKKKQVKKEEVEEPQEEAKEPEK